jgi:K+-transporting ATPase ATPase A chain
LLVQGSLPLNPAGSAGVEPLLAFNTNSAHPYENPTPFTNFLQMLAILMIPAALTHTYGIMVGDTR